MEQKIKKWRKQVNNILNEAIDLNNRGYVFNKQKEIIENNQSLSDNNIFIYYLFRNSWDSQVLAISRLVEDKSVDSFIDLINDMLSNYNEIIHSGELTSFLFKEIKNDKMTHKHEQGKQDIQDHFKKEIEERMKVFSWDKINSDKFDILKETAKIKQLRNKHIAHKDKKRKRIIIDLNEINSIAIFIEDKISEYYTLLTNKHTPKNDSTGAFAHGIEQDIEIFNGPWIINK